MAVYTFFPQSLTEIQNIVQSNQTTIEENQSLFTQMMNQIEYEIRCIQRFGQFFRKSIWMLSHEYFSQKVNEMVMTWKKDIFTQLLNSLNPGHTQDVTPGI